MADILKLGKEKAASQVIDEVQKGRGTRLLESILDSLLGEHFDEDKSVWCLWLLSGGKEPHEFINALKKQNSSPVCGLVWNEQFVAYRCRDCAISPCMSLCADCFVAGNHEGHDFNMFRSKAGGACDCGDENVMRKQGFCSKHGSEKTPKEVTLPMDLDVIAKCLVPRLFLKIYEDFQTRSIEGLGSSSYLPPSLEKLIKLLQMICEADAFRNLTAKVLLQTIPKSITPKKSKQNSGQTVASRLKPTNSTASGHTLVHSVPSSPPAFDFMLREENFAILDHSDINPLGDVNLESGNCSYLEILMQTLVKYEFPGSLATFMLLLLPEPAYKESFTRSFCRNYVAIGQSLPHSRRPDLLSNHLVHVSVQLFSSEALATTMVREEKLLYTLVGVLVDMIGGCLQSYEYNFEGKVTSVLVADCDHRILINHCYWPVASDLLNILSHKQVVREFLGNDTIMHQWMYLVTLLTGMNVNNRRIASHIQFEPRTYITSFSVEFESVAAVVWELLRGCEKLKDENDRYVLKLIKATENALRDWYNFVPVRPSKSTTTFHLSLHRYLALFISQAIVRFGLDERDALPSLDFLLRCVEYPLRTLVAVSEIKAGYWVYSGFQMRGQALSYVQCHFCNSMVDVDLFFVQILASKVDPNFFLKMLIERFSLGAWFQFGKPVADSPQRQDIDKENSMVESFLSFILILVSQRVLSGMSDTCQGHKDLAALLCVSNKTHSQLTELIPTRPGESNEATRNLENSLKKMADFKAPTLDEDVMQQGTYSPKDSVWDQDFDYVHVLHRFFMPSEYQKASQRYTENMRQRGTTVHSHCWPPFKDLSEIHPCFKGIFRMLQCQTLQKIIYFVIYKAVKNVNSVTELMLVNTMHLLHLALRTPKVTDEGVIPNTEHFKSKKVTLAENCVDYLEKFVDQSGGLYGTGEREFRELNTVLYNKLTGDEGCRLDQESCELEDVATILQHVLFSKNKLSFFEPMLAYMDNVVADGDSQESFVARRLHHLQYLLSIIPEDRYLLLKKLFSHWRKCTSKDNVKITSYSFCMQRKERIGFSMLLSHCIDHYDWLFRICNVRPNQPKTVLDIGFKNQSIIENASVPVCSLDDELPQTGEQIEEAEDLGKKESLLSLLVALLAKLKEASKFVQTKRSNDEAMDGQDIRAGDGTYRVTELLQELHESSAKNQAIIDRLAPKIGRSEGQNKRSGVADDSLSERLDRRKKAMARQKKILEEFMTKQEMFKEQHMSIDMDVDDGSKGEMVVSERQFDCVICGQTSHSTVDRPFGVAVLMQPSTVLGQRRKEGIDLLPLEDKKYSLTCGRVCEQRKKALLKSFDKVAVGRAFEAGLDCGVHVQTCGHYLHIDCHQSYFKSLQEEHIRNFSYEQLPFDIQKGYFTCPLCRQPCNGVLPVLADVIRKREAKRNLTSSDKCLAEISSLLQRYSEAGHLTSLTAKALEFTVLTASATTFVSRLSNTLKSEGHPSTALYSDRTIKEKFLILVSTVRTCLELDVAESDIGIRQRDAKRSCIENLLEMLQFYAQCLDSPMISLWRQLINDPACSDKSLEEECKRSKIPILLYDVSSLLIQFVLTWPTWISMDHFKCIVRVLFNVNVIQALTSICMNLRNDEFPRTGGLQDSNNHVAYELLGLVGDSLSGLKDKVFENEGMQDDTMTGISLSLLSPQAIELQIQDFVLPFLRLAASLAHVLFAASFKETQVQKEFQTLVTNLGLVASEGTDTDMQDLLPTDCLKWHFPRPDEVIQLWCDQLMAAAFIEKNPDLTILPVNHNRSELNLVVLPSSYDSLFQFYRKKACSRCNKAPDHPALCLICGEFCCFQSSCCADANGTYECAQHSVTCGSGTCVFLIVSSSSVLIIRGERACIWGSVYLDSFGEEDKDLGRGKPLFLSRERYDHLSQQWLTHRFDRSCKRWELHNGKL